MASDGSNALLFYITIAFCGCAGLLSLASVVFGLVSWIVLPNWRQFRNYVFLCLLLPYVFDFIILCLRFSIGPLPSEEVEAIINQYISQTFTHWMVITTVMFYIEFVEVFTSLNAIKHKYIYANTFGWLLPLVEVVIWEVAGVDPLYFRCCLLLTNLALYLRVLFALCRPSSIYMCGEGVGKKIVLSAFAFLTTGSYSFITFLVFYVKEIFYFVVFVHNFCALVIVLINIFFLMLKSHRELWKEHLQRVRSNTNKMLRSNNIV